MRIGIGLGLTGLRPASAGAADPLAAYYGTGMEQMPMHYAPEDAVLDGSGNVTTVANRGGAGALFNATAPVVGLTRSGNLLNVTTAAARLALANPADMVGVRTFMVVALAANADPFPRLLGHPSPANLIRVNSSTGQLLLQRDGSQVFMAAPITPPGTALRLWEVEIANGRAKAWMGGVLTADVACAFSTFQVSTIFAAFDASGFTGLAGDVASVITDGTPARDATMLAVRQILAAKYEITLA